MSTAPKQSMTVDDFLHWAETQEKGRYELIDGHVYAMAPERVAHVRAKLSCTMAFQRAIKAAGVPCEAFVDGLAIKIDDHTTFEPDSVVNCGPRLESEKMIASDPIIVLEVVSPSSMRIDSSVKLEGYFKVPSIMHYLLVDTGKRAVVIHQRGQSGKIATSILRNGTLSLDPPGISVEIESLFE